jgi:hypothetical protein
MAARYSVDGTEVIGDDVKIDWSRVKNITAADLETLDDIVLGTITTPSNPSTNGVFGVTRSTPSAGTVRFAFSWTGGNCVCNCVCVCDGGGTCFPAGSLVLMADGTWREITRVGAGDYVYSPTGPAKVSYLHVTLLADRPLYRMADHSVTWSAEHSFWVKRDSQQWLWTMSPERLKWEEDIGLIAGIRQWHKLMAGRECQPELFAHLQGWRRATPMRIAAAPRCLPLYLPRTEGGELIVIDGYLVGAFVNERAFDYDRLDWDRRVAPALSRIEAPRIEVAA